MNEFLRALMAAIVAVGIAGPAIAGAAELVGLKVRVTVDGITGEQEGVFRTVEGCLYVQFARATREGYTLSRVDGVRALAVFESGAWRSRDVRPIAAAEPARCREAASD